MLLEKKSNSFLTKIQKFSPLKVFHLPLSTQILISICIGLICGIILRIYPNCLSFFGISATSFYALGNLFIKMVKMIAMPLIFACILQSVISLCRKTSAGKITLLTIFVFVCITIICITVGMGFTIFFKPGTNATFDKESFLDKYSDQQISLANAEHGQQLSIIDFLFNIVPSNIFVAFSQMNFLQIIFFAILLAIGIAKVDKKGDIYHGIKILAQIFMEVVQIVMKFAPFGTFGISTWLIATQETELLKSLGKLICVDWLAVAFTIYVAYSIVCILLKLNPVHLWKKLFPTQVIAFLTTSSSATLPLGMKVAQEKLGVSEEKNNFVAPFSAAINSSGGGMYFAVITIFMAQLFDIELTIHQYITLFIMSALCDLGVAPVPGGSLIMLGNVFVAVGIPLEALGIAFAIDRILDMTRTLMNFTGDIFASVVVDRIFGTLDIKTYNKEKKRFIFF